MTRAAVYARFSSDLQQDRSIDDQLALCRSVASREGLEVVATFADRAKSGATLFDREGVAGLISAARAGAFNVLIVESLDRLSRDQADLAYLYKRLEFANVKIHTANEGVTTSIHIGLRGIMGQMFLKDLGDKVRRGHAGRVREGKFPGSVTYGYRSIPGKPGERAIDPERAEVVRRIFREYAAGVSPRTIAQRLTQERIPTPNGAVAWNHQTLIGGGHRGIVGNPIYVGELAWNTMRTVLNPETGKKTKRRTPEDTHLLVSAPHLRIIEQPLWDAAQALRAGRATTKFGPGGKMQRRLGRLTSDKHLLTGLLRCGACGGHMRIAQQSRNGGPRVACAAAHQHSSCSHTKSYDLNKLQAGVLAGMRDQLANSEALAEAARALQAGRATREKRNRVDADGLRKRIARLDIQLDRIVTAIADSDTPIPVLTAKLKPLQAERDGAAEQLRLVEADSKVETLYPANVEAFQAKIEKLHEELARDSDSPENRMAFRNLVDSIVVHPTAKRANYEFTPYARLGAIAGIALLDTSSDKGNAVNRVLPISQQIISLGRWLAAA